MLNRRRIYVAVFSCLLGFISFGQENLSLDSLQGVINSRIGASEKLASYNWLSAYSPSPLDRIEYGNTLLSTARRLQSKEYIYHANYNLGVAYQLIGKLPTALEHLLRSAKVCQENADLQKYLPDVYTEISACYTQNGDGKNALLFGQKAIQLLRESDDDQQLALTMLNYAYDLYLAEQYDSAMIYYDESETLLETIGLEIGLAYIKGNRALVFWKNGEIQQAKQDLQTAVEMLQPFEDWYGISDYYNQLGSIHYEEKDVDPALKYANQSFELASREDLKEQARDAAKLLSMIYEKQKMFEQAFEYQSQYFKYRDSIQNLSATQELANLRIEYELDQKQAQVDLLLEQKQSNRTIILIGGVSLITVLALALIAFLSFRSKKNLSHQLEEKNSSLVKVNQTKDRFFSIISHDLRGPINALNGLVSVVKIYLDKGNTKNLKELTQRMEESLEKIISLLDSLLSWSLQQQEHFRYFPEYVDPRVMINEVLEMFQNMALSKKISLVSKIDQESTIFVDKNTTSTLLRNLVNNALKFTSEGGNITISSTPDSIRNQCLIEITDSGVGIPKEKLATLFELDSNISTNGTSGESGLGLGLQLVKEFISLNHGSIEVVSQEGVGTSFLVSLPMEPQE